MASNRNELWKSLCAFKTGNNEKLLKGERFDFNITKTVDGMIGTIAVALVLSESQTSTGGLGYDAAPQPPAPAPAPAPAPK